MGTARLPKLISQWLFLNLCQFPGLLKVWTATEEDSLSKPNSPDAANARQFRDGPTAEPIRYMEAELREQMRKLDK
jgi:hypothetical protein